jgi:hypothetical protein
MVKEIEKIKIRTTVTAEDKQILRIALDGISGWNFYPIAVIKKGIEDYYFICKVKTIIKNLKIKTVKVYIKVQDKKGPMLLSIEEIV